MSTIAIGDIHGNAAALKDLLERIRAEVGRDDTVAFLGDYIDRGPDSRGCIDAILEFGGRGVARVVCLRGNHEDWLLRTRDDYTRHSWLLGMHGLDTVRSYSADAERTLHAAVVDAGLSLYTRRVALPYDALFEAMPPSHREFLENLQWSLSTADCFCSHAGLDPALPLEDQTADALVWGAAAFPLGYRGELPVVYGHWNDAVLNENRWPLPNVRANTIGIDTISHGVLTAIRMPDRVVFQSAAHRYAD